MLLSLGAKRRLSSIHILPTTELSLRLRGDTFDSEMHSRFSRRRIPRVNYIYVRRVFMLTHRYNGWYGDNIISIIEKAVKSARRFNHKQFTYLIKRIQVFGRRFSIPPFFHFFLFINILIFV